jgi:signal transduction histidine kinase
MDMRQINARKLRPDVTGVTLQVKYWPTLELALKLQPETKQVVIVDGASPNDQALEKLVRDELREHEKQNQLKFIFLAGLATDDLVKRLSALPSHTVVLFVSFAQDGKGRSFLPDDAVKLVSRAANAPTYINSDDVLDSGAMGGSLISFGALGRDTAKLALRILNGEKAASIPIADATVRFKTLDARQLRHWNISWANVPSDTVVLNKMPSIWESYRWWIVGGMSLIALQGILIAMLLLHRRQRRMAEQNLRISEANRHAAVLEERSRMARDMHDTLAQGFTGIILQLQAAQQAVAHGSSAEMDAHIHRASELARWSLAEARRSIKALRPQALETKDLRVAMEDAIKQMTAGTGLRAELTTYGRIRPLGPACEEGLLRIQQEILTNALKHSSAQVVNFRLLFEENTIRLEVQDDGVGLDISKNHDGLGLLGIRERVHQLNGEITIDSRIGFGTRTCVVLSCPTEPRDSRS